MQDDSQSEAVISGNSPAAAGPGWRRYLSQRENRIGLVFGALGALAFFYFLSVLYRYANTPITLTMRKARS